jgi:hypothetical protein
MERLPPFIARDGQLLATPPITMATTLYMFLLEADWDRLNALCDQQLNLGGSTVYRPLLPSVMLYCSAERTAPVNDPIGWCPEKDFGIWVPVAAGHLDGGGRFVAERALVFTPYLWIDSGVAMTGGREVFGFPKATARLGMPAGPTDPASFTVDTQVVPRFAPDSEVVERRLLEVARLEGGLLDELATLWHTGEGLLGALGHAIARLATGHARLPLVEPGLILGLLRQVGRRVPMVFLKQFPDAADGTRACYQALVEASIDVVSGLEGGWLPGEYGITVNRYDSHRIVENLGLKPAESDGERALVKSLVHGWVRFDARVQPGRVVWQAP